MIVLIKINFLFYHEPRGMLIKNIFERGLNLTKDHYGESLRSHIPSSADITTC